jgi:hypothetical protein
MKLLRLDMYETASLTYSIRHHNLPHSFRPLNATVAQSKNLPFGWVNKVPSNTTKMDEYFSLRRRHVSTRHWVIIRPILICISVSTWNVSVRRGTPFGLHIHTMALFLLCSTVLYVPIRLYTQRDGCTKKKLPFGINTTIELKNIETASHINGVWQGMFHITSVPVLWDVIDTF